MSTCTDVGSVIESKTSVVQASNVGFTSEVSDYLVMHTGPGFAPFSVAIILIKIGQVYIYIFFFFFFFFFFFAFPSYISGVHHFWVRFLRM